MANGLFLIPRWTETATNALWFGNVHALVAKLKASSFS
jgi:hypothetical protein